MNYICNSFQRPEQSVISGAEEVVRQVGNQAKKDLEDDVKKVEVSISNGYNDAISAVEQGVSSSDQTIKNIAQLIVKTQEAKDIQIFFRSAFNALLNFIHRIWDCVTNSIDYVLYLLTIAACVTGTYFILRHAKTICDICCKCFSFCNDLWSYLNRWRKHEQDDVDCGESSKVLLSKSEIV